MATLSKEQISYAILAVIISTTAAVAAIGLPLENFFSEYFVSRFFPWYVAWRVAIMELILWIGGLMLNAFEEKFSKPFLLFTSILFALAHYYKLSIISSYDNAALGIACRVSVYPLFYVLTCNFATGFSADTFYLDMGQIVLIITFFTLVPVKKVKSILKTSLLAPSDT